ncbi:VOC family protein [Streptomyces sp. ISL-44]|uniref:VOC family protein n=1 Tax=Streptomyces sp. ISL-44 TaxID=2819184 RepID=UPI001BE85844|nr:VOC family protein [Streptomyces sp. ISL-44]MBT2540143.1 VOC family protein [Streptomyces sp. ISL-44]
MTVPKTSVLILDCAEPEPLARFYAELLGATAGPATGNGELFLVTGRTGTVLGVRRDPHHAPPSWPLPEESQQAHLRILVAADSLDEAEREAVVLGARPVAAEEDGTRLDNRTTLRRFTDPAGHSFVIAAVREDPTPLTGWRP